MTDILLDDLTVGQARELAKLFGSTVDSNPAGFWEIGKPYLIRTVTMIDTGVLVAVTPQEIILRDAAWIADTGRFAAALESCEYNEVEPFPEGLVAIGRGSIIEAVKIKKVPRGVK
jgi:hypothetical protein